MIYIDNAAGQSIALGSGVVVGEGKIITNCHVAEAKGSASIRVIARTKSYPAAIKLKLRESDLCLLEVKDFNAPAAQIKSLKQLNVGQRVYAIGAPSGLELTLTEGLISGLRALPSGETLIQTSAPISHGSSGGGLFSENGELVGVTSFGLTSGSALNFAHAAEYILGMIILSESTSTKYHDNENENENPSKSIFSDRETELIWKKQMSLALSKYFPNEDERMVFLETVVFEATRAGLDVEMILGLIDAASQFRKYALSADGARGFMQVNPAWVARIGKKDHNLFNLRTNLRYGCIVIRHYLELTSGDYYNGLTMYAENNFPKGTSGNVLSGHEFVDRTVTLWKKRWSKLKAISDSRKP